MDNKEIGVRVNELPYSTLGEVQDDSEIWEIQDGEASVKVTKHYLPTPKRDPALFMTVSGPMEERQRVIGEFIAVYGPTSIPLESEPHMDTAVWVNPSSKS
jgi:hypothetical protein